MCGIAGFHIKERYKGQLPVDDMLDYLLLHIQERGRHATGFAAMSFGATQTIMDKKDVRADEFIFQRKRLPENVQTVIGHTRWATQGRPEDNENNHPVLFGTCFATHNGQINNDDAVVKEELGEGVVRPAEVDSIAIPIVLTNCGMDSMENIKTALEKLSGSMSVSVFDIQHPGQLLLAKGDSSPLYMLNHKYGYFWASTQEALEFMWGTMIGTPPSRKAKTPQDAGIYQFQWGDAVLINGNRLESFDFKPKYRTFTPWTGGSSYGTSSFRRWDDYDDTPDYGWSDYIKNKADNDVDEDGRTRIKSRITTANYVKTVRYTCTPSAERCEHPCSKGCLKHDCECTETVYDFKADYDGKDFDPDFNPTSFCYAGEGEEVDEAQVEEADLTLSAGLIRCDACWDWYGESRMEDVLIGSETFILCDYCATAKTLEVGSDMAEVTRIAERTEPEVKPDKDPNGDLQEVYEEAERRHKYALFNTAESMGCNEGYVDWLLFKLTMEDLAKFPTLGTTREMFDEEYTHYYEGMEV